MDIYLPEITYQAAAVTEWAACLLYWLPAPRRSGRWQSAMLAALLLAGQYFLHTHIFGWLPDGIPGLPSGFGLLIVRGAGVLVNVLFMMAGMALMTRYSFISLLYATANAFVIAELTASTACLIYDLWVIAGGSTGTVQEVLFYGGMCVFILLALYRSVEKESVYLQRGRISGSQAAVAALIACSAFFVSNSSIALTNMNFTTVDSMMSRVILRLVGDLCGLLTLWMLGNSIAESETRDELAAVKNTLDQQYQQYLTFRETSEYIAQQNHDLKHQIRALRTSVSEEERESYIEEMEHVLAVNEAWNVTGNSALDSILTQKKMYCIRHDIEFSCQAKAQELEQLSVRDICSLFGNIIDNAIEHVSGFEEKEKRVIRGTVEKKRSFLVVEFENYYEGPEWKDGTIPATSKKDRTRHGYGLKSVQYVAEKYNGTMSLRGEGNWFTIRVLLPVRPVDLHDQRHSA